MKPLFIVFDGIDGDGKSTQSLLLKEWLEAKGLEVFMTSEPSKSEQGQIINDLLRKKQAASIPKEKWLELFTADRAENVREIRAALQEGKIVICDRYYYSTLAYQLNEEEWQAYASQFLQPDITFVLDVPAETGMERTKAKYEITGEKKAFFEKLEILRGARKKFLVMPRFLKDNIKIVDSTGPIKAVAEDIKKEIMLLLK
jgi:dTMP kinase